MLIGSDGVESTLIHIKEFFRRAMAVDAIGQFDSTPLDKSFVARSRGGVPEAPERSETTEEATGRTFP